MNQDVVASLQLLGLGYVPAVLLGMSVGVVLGLDRWVYAVAQRVLQFPASLPTIALIPAGLLLLKQNQPVAIGLVCFSAVWAILLQTATASQQWQQYPAQRQMALFSLVNGLRQGMRFAWLTVISLEMLTGVNQGLGFVVWDAYNLADQKRLTDALIAIGVIGFLLDQGLDIIGWLIARKFFKLAESSKV